MKLDAGGIARGYAADAVTDVLWHRGVQRCMVEAGEVVTFADPPPGKRGWRSRCATARCRRVRR